MQRQYPKEVQKISEIFGFPVHHCDFGPVGGKGAMIVETGLSNEALDKFIDKLAEIRTKAGIKQPKLGLGMGPYTVGPIKDKKGKEGDLVMDATWLVEDPEILGHLEKYKGEIQKAIKEAQEADRKKGSASLSPAALEESKALMANILSPSQEGMDKDNSALISKKPGKGMGHSI